MSAIRGIASLIDSLAIDDLRAVAGDFRRMRDRSVAADGGAQAGCRPPTAGEVARMVTRLEAAIAQREAAS